MSMDFAEKYGPWALSAVDRTGSALIANAGGDANGPARIIVVP